MNGRVKPVKPGNDDAVAPSESDAR